MSELQDEIRDLVAWIDSQVGGLELPTDEKSLIVAGCLDVAIEHLASIEVLCRAGLFGSALALLRVLAESTVRGMWMYRCAGKIEIGKYKRGKLDKSFQNMIEEYEAAIETPGGVLSGFKAASWKALNGFTHTGFEQITRRHAPGQVGSNYDSDEVEGALRMAGAWGLMAALKVAMLANRQDLAPAFMDRIKHYRDRSYVSN